MREFNEINFIRCPMCGETALRVGDFGPNEYRITCDNCDFTSDTHLSDCGEVLCEFICEEYARRTMEGARKNRDKALYDETISQAQKILGANVTEEKIISYLKERVNNDLFHETSIHINKYILQLVLMIIEGTFESEKIYK